MKRTYCDVCDKELSDGEPGVQRFTIYDNHKAIDICSDCYAEFNRWLRSKKIEN